MHLHAEGFVPDLADFYRRVRVAIAPLRFGAGVKLKTVEALQYGVPVVATTVGAEGLEALPGDVIAVHDDPAGFAAAVVARLRDVETWRAHRAAIDRVMAEVPTSTDWAAWLAETTMEGANVGHPV
jgi:glycosyltransferase involved in cell wall biosynthesis